MNAVTLSDVQFEQPTAGEWVQPVRGGYLMECCDCGLVHRLDFRVLKVHKNRKLATVQGSRYYAQFRVYREGYRGFGQPKQAVE